MNSHQNRYRLQRISALLTLASAVLLITACGTPPRKDAGFQANASSNDSDADRYGRVESIQVSKVQDSDQIGVGTVVGGLIGGLIANQIGGGNGKMLATAAGAGSGAYAGHALEMKDRPREVYHIRVQLDSGDYRTVSQDSDADLNVGNRVHIDNGHVYRY